jgi:hypothetical protein
MTTTSIIEQERKLFEAKFDCTGLVYEKHSLSENMVYSPANAQISQSWTLANLRNNQWTAWQAARQSSQSEPVATADYIAYLYSDGNKLKIAEEMPPPDNAFPVFTTNIRFLDVARLVLDDSVDLILEHGGVKLWEALVTKVNKDYADGNLAAPQQAIHSGWISVDDRLPNLSCVEIKRLDVLCRFETYKDKPHYKVVPYVKRRDSVPSFEDGSSDFITHWMPLPASPTAPIERDK